MADVFLKGRIKKQLTSTTIPTQPDATGYIAAAPSPRDPIQPNVIHIVLDDAGMLQLPGYDELNAWPASMVYPAMPWLQSKINTGVMFTRSTNSPRCSPFRAEFMSGRKAHVSAGHPHGHGISDTPNWQVPAYGFPGLLAEHRALPSVCKLANPDYAHGLFGKWHLHDYDTIQSDSAITNRGDVCDVHGFDIFEDSVLSGSGSPAFGYWGFKTYTVTPGSVVDNGTLNGYVQGGTPADPAAGPIQSKRNYARMTLWLATILGADPDQAFHLEYWCHEPHDTLPAWDGAGQAPGGANYTLSFTEDQMVPTASGGAEGQTAAGGYDEDGGVDGGNVYGPQGRCNVLARRAVAMLECWDQTMQLLDDWLFTNHPDAHANTLWVITSDNGVTGSEAIPIKDDLFNTKSGGAIGTVFPPTVESYNAGSPPTYSLALETSTTGGTGTPFHDHTKGKGTVYQEAINSPLVFSGPMLPGHMHGVKNGALIESCDLYPTFLDIMAGYPRGGATGRVTWQEALGATDLAKIDGVSFYSSLFDITAGDREYAFVQSFKPTNAPAGSETDIERAVFNRAHWKLIYSLVDPGPATKELYYLIDDPREFSDLYTDATRDPAHENYNAEAALQLADLEAELARRIA